MLDTSVAAGWFFTDEPLRVQSLAVRDHLRDAPHLYVVPHLFYSELLHVLARKSAAESRFVEAALDLILHLGVRTLPLSRAALLRAAGWACRGMSGYDATFVALAEDVGGKWLTADERAAKIAGGERAVTVQSWVEGLPEG